MLETGKYLSLWLRDAEISELFALPPDVGGGEWWMISGRIEGLTPELGVWVSLDSVQAADAAPIDLTKLRATRAATLLPWATIRRANLFSHRPDAMGIGLRPSRASDLRA